MRFLSGWTGCNDACNRARLRADYLFTGPADRPDQSMRRSASPASAALICSMASFTIFGFRSFSISRLGFLEGLGGARRDLDEVIAELRSYGLADLADWQRKRRLVERRNHLAVPEGAEVAALESGTGIVGFGFGQGGEIGARQDLGLRMSFALASASFG